MQTFEEYCEYFEKYFETKDKELSEKIHDLMLRNLPRAVWKRVYDYNKVCNDSSLDQLIKDFWDNFCW